jgi:methionyl-tRNA formyltransferase
MKTSKEKINILIDKESWFIKYGLILKKKLEKNFQVRIVYDQNKIQKSFINFILSFGKKISKNNLDKSKCNIVIHASNLPLGRGFSPMTWKILEGKNIIPIVLFEADQNIDTGEIFLKDNIKLAGHELCNEWRRMQAQKTIDLCIKFTKNFNKLVKKKQNSSKISYYRKRTKEDSIIDLNKTLKEQFNLLRVVDNNNYPAFFEYKKHRYRLKIEKI